MKKICKFLSLFLAMVLLVSTFSTVVFASEGEAASDAVKFYIASNDAKYVANGVVSDVSESNTITNKTDTLTRLFYRLDCTPFIGKTVSKVTLKFWADRNNSGNPNFTINKLKNEVWQGETIGTLSGTYWDTGSSATAEKTYTNTEGAENYINNGSYYPIEIDVTTIFNNAEITKDAPYLNLMLRSGIYNAPGTKIAGPSLTEYAPYFEVSGITGDSTVYFEGNDAEGTIEAVSGQEGTSMTVPECTFTKTGYSFVKWADSQGNFYMPNDTYTFKNLNDTLTAVWSYDAFSTTKFAIASNDAKYVANGVVSDVSESNTITNNNDTLTRLFYRLDCTPFIGKTVSKVTLKFWADRNYAGNPNFTINKLKNEVWQGDTIGTLSGTYWGTDSSAMAEKTYTNTEGAENYINNGSYYPIEIDVTTIFNNAEITKDAPYLNLMLRSGIYNAPGTKIAGLSHSEYAPYFEVVAKESSYFISIDEFGSEEAVTTMEAAEKCDEIVAETGIASEKMLPLAAIYSTADNSLIDVIIGDENTSSLTLSNSVYAGGDKYIKFFVFVDFEDITPLIPVHILK